MISLIKGKIVSLLENKVVVLTSGGVGYGLVINTATLEKLTVGNEIEMPTYLAVRENAMDLYGFISISERELFVKLLSVNGIGPKSALNILSLGKTDEIIRAIVNKDADFLAEAHGIGKKAAERIVLDLNNKLGEAAIIAESLPVADKTALSDAVEGLVSLGYSRAEALNAVKELGASGKSSQEILREALKNLGR